jgi:CDP-diacylglycerol--serine O-phosphatidyltransferase
VTGGRRTRFGLAIRMAPNLFTLAGLCAGVTAIRFSAEQDWTLSVSALTLAGVCDLIDGRLARALGAQSEFGAQLDSLADLVSFGVAPSILVYQWSLSSTAFGWAPVLLFVACSALRLARFNCNVAADQAPSPDFVGLPAPGAAGLTLLPLLLSLQFGDNPALSAPALVMTLLILLALAMVSRLPTPSLKRFPLRRLRWPGLTAAAVLVGLLAVRWPWGTASAAWLLYAIVLPFGPAFRRLKTARAGQSSRRARGL